MIKEIEGKVVILEMICDNCSEGKMQGSMDLLTLCNPPKFKHYCDKCGNEQYYEVKYPTFAVRSI